MAEEQTAEQTRLQEDRDKQQKWKKWGPYLSERQWGTVREDYSPHGEAWDYFSHDVSRSRAYRWGEDGIAGYSDDQQRLCLSVGLWNGHDPILKERLFGLTNSEGNHGEDVKELYYYLDATPTHSYLRMLYKYPQSAYPYQQLIDTNRGRGKNEPEFELIDTGVFDQDRYFDVFVEYAKAGPRDTLMRITVHNRGPEDAPIHVLPQIWFRNTWSWVNDAVKPQISLVNGNLIALHPDLGEYALHHEGDADLLFTDNDTNVNRLYGQQQSGFFKDAFHEAIVHGNREAVNPQHIGTKAAVHFQTTVPAGGSQTFRLRLAKGENNKSFADFDAIFEARQHEADEFYNHLQTELVNEDARLVQRQAFAGMIWGKQYFQYDVRQWLKGDPTEPPPPTERLHGRNADWKHVNCADIISMPDTWEYPWFAAWDLAFHCIPFALIDPEFAKSQLVLLTREWYMHPNGQLPAYEWAFGDVNPPVHAWAAWRVFQIDRKQRGDGGDLYFLERVFHKLMINFTWWVNRKDAQGRNIFQGGFLGLDNIGVVDRSAPLPTGGFISQADGTSWMAMYSLNLLRIALELSRHDAVFEDIATKFFEHFLHIAEALNDRGDENVGLWDEADQFYYDELNLPDGTVVPLKVRSIVGLIPLFAVETLEPELCTQLTKFTHRMEWLLNNRPDLADLVSHWNEPGHGERRLLSLLRGHRMKCLLRRMLDETEFLSDYGIRAVSKIHKDHPYVFEFRGTNLMVDYEPGESTSGLFGGNSNWRGPIWMPINFLIIESLQKFYHYYGDDFKVECPTGSGHELTILEIANELTRRLSNLFLRDDNGHRAVFSQYQKMQNDPNFRDNLLFYEYFHGDSGRGVGASHQTGWTGLIAKLLQPRKNED